MSARTLPKYRAGFDPVPRGVTRVGIISDTHGLLRPEALAFLEGCDRIIHGGDIGKAEVLQRLGALAPVTAVRGNNDAGKWADEIAESELFEIDGTWFYAIHDLAELDIDPIAAGVQVVVSGHSHKPVVERRDRVLYVNPGSAGPRRFRLPIAVAELVIDGGKIEARIVELDIGS
jgi:putative phosphoesterase